MGADKMEPNGSSRAVTSKKKLRQFRCCEEIVVITGRTCTRVAPDVREREEKLGNTFDIGHMDAKEKY